MALLDTPVRFSSVQVTGLFAVLERCWRLSGTGFGSGLRRGTDVLEAAGVVGTSSAAAEAGWSAVVEAAGSAADDLSAVVSELAAGPGTSAAAPSGGDSEDEFAKSKRL